MNGLKRLVTGSMVAVIALASRGQAQVINSANVAGLTTFQDVNTGRVWLDLNNFFDQTPDQMLSVANSAGFTLATTADLNQLLSGLPLNSGQWASYAAVMGNAPNRNLMWAFYDDDSGDPYGWAYGYDYDVSWNVLPDQAPGNVVPNGGTDFADMDIWAYQSGQVTGTPEPTSFALMATGVVGLGAAYRRRRRAV